MVILSKTSPDALRDKAQEEVRKAQNAERLEIFLQISRGALVEMAKAVEDVNKE